MDKIKYIYFEVNYIIGIDPTEKRIENENALMFKPNTNSSGYWGFRNLTERANMSRPTFSVVEQFWIDLETFKGVEYPDLQEFIDKVLVSLKKMSDE